jgi:hypothetical protein
MATKYDSQEFLGRKECANYLTALGIDIAPKTLSNLAANNNGGNGPPFIRTRWSKVYYRRTDVDEWAKAQTVHIK